MFLPIPAIDLMDGKVVRLARGEAQAKTVYSDDPAGIAKKFAQSGARRIHVVDLDGAFGGRARNRDSLKAIRDAVDIEIETGGGLRADADVEAVLELGINYAILGTSAVRDRDLVARLAWTHGDRIIVGIDAKDGRVAIEGWTETSNLSQIDFAKELEKVGIGTVVATDIATDGMMTGPNLSSLQSLAKAVKINIIASGGIRDVDDLLAVRDLGKSNLVGAITGRAVYEGKLDIAEAVRRLLSNR